MATDLRAAFTLKLVDQMSSPLRQCMEMVQRFQALTKRLGFKELDGADATVQRLGKDIGVVNSQLGATARQAEAAASSIRRMSGAELSRARAMGAQAQQLNSLRGGGLSQIYGPGGIPLMAGGPRFVPNEEGASSRMGWRGRAGNALTATRERFGQANAQIGLAGGAMAGISLMEPIRQAAEFDNVLTHIAITAGATGEQVRGRVADMAQRYREMALAVKQSSHDVAESAQFLITTGIGEEMTNKLLPIIAKAATAYNTPMRDAVQGAFSMHEELGIKPEDMQGALSATALAAKQGHFSFSDFSSSLPAIAAQAGHAGFHGREGLNALLAALETSRRGAGTSGQAATNLQDFLGYINAPIGAKSFEKGGINLPKLLETAEKAKQNPLEAVVEAVRKRTEKMTEAQSANYIGRLFHNQEARLFVQTMLHELKYYQETKDKVSKAGVETINEDFAKAQNLHTRLVELSETSHQLTQKIGLGFSWVVPVATGLLGGVLVGLGWMDHHLPGVADGAIGLTGGMLGLTAVLGVLGTVAGRVKAGWLLLGGAVRFVGRMLLWTARAAMANPLIGVTLLLGAAAIDVWRHWDRFRQSWHLMWSGLRVVAGGFGDFLTGLFWNDNQRAATGLLTMWNGVVTSWRAVWGKSGFMEKLFGDFASRIDGWTGGLATALGTAMQTAMGSVVNVIRESLEGWQKLFRDFKPEIPGITGGLPMAPPPGMTPENWPRYQAPGLKSPTSYQLQPPTGAPAERAAYEHVIRIQTDDGVKATARSGDRSVRFTGAAVDRGSMLTRT